MLAFHPIRIQGPWKDGYALDRHIISSTYLGDDESGHPRFDTVRTEMGERLYRLKYRADQAAVEEIAESAVAFLGSWNPGVSAIVPVPPSKARHHQPVFLLADEIGRRFKIPVVHGLRKNMDTAQMKNVTDFRERLALLQRALAVDESCTRGQRVLLFDDVFQSGATLHAATAILSEPGGAAEVYALTVTMTQGA